MPAASPPDATELLQAWSRGDASAFDKLIPLVYRELRALAGRYMRNERPDHTLQPTSLVNEAYLRLIDINRVQWQNRAHFLAVAATTMRRILVEFARKRHRDKRGGDITLVALDDAPDTGQAKRADLVAVDDALTALAAVDRRLSQVIELRFFGGLTVDETADVLNISPETVMRDAKTAKAWLLRELSQASGRADAG
ncbi:MAG TPA: sigma-70 family RNA polymerase sigma factor [Vicinamibacterales bacterium]|nr:sigma-70 family RNA polymerase sigma factor [Vicinamibacterales bacterium]